MGNDIDRDAHYDITIGNDIDRDAYCDIIMVMTLIEMPIVTS